MGIFQQTDCCCFFSLATGSKIIAALTVLMGISNLIDGFSSINADDKYVYVSNIIIGFAAIIIGIMLFYGAAAKRSGFILPYIIINILRIIFGIILAILAAIYGTFWATITYFIIAYLINVYFTLVVYSFYQELQGGVGSNV